MSDRCPLDGDDRTGARAVSTVLDVALFLLLVSAAVGLLHVAPRAESPDRAPDVAAETSTTLATATTTVTWESAGESGDDAAWQSRATVAEHLASAAVANATVDGRPLGRAEPYEAAVRTSTHQALDRIQAGTDVRVRAVWEPLSGSGVRGEVTVGSTPPPDVDVHAATLEVPVGSARDGGIAAPAWEEAAGGWPNRTNGSANRYAGDASGDVANGGTANETGGDADRPSIEGASVAAPTNHSLVDVAERAGCEGLAREISRRVVGTTFPPGRIQAVLRAGGVPRDRAIERYRTAARAVEEPTDGLPVADDARATNAVLVDALAAEFRPLSCAHEGPADAARVATPGTVTVSVRTWSS